MLRLLLRHALPDFHREKIIVCVWVLMMGWLLSSCGTPVMAKDTAWIPPTLVPTYTATATLIPSATLSPTPTHTATATPTETPTPTSTATATLVPTPTWASFGPGEVTAPILLYHHIAESETGNRYYISPTTFKQQMNKLKELGYETITASELAKVILHGGNLPPRPVVITFDDGDLDVFENAYPILKDLGYVASMYVVSNYMDQPNFLSSDQLKKLADSGWEIGSHSSNHYDLTLNYGLFYQEMNLSRQNIEASVGVELRTFAYPYGKVDPNVMAKISEYGYLAGMGLGTAVTHSPYTIYYLSRQEVQSTYSMETFLTLLPWK
jgi:peptidoglycan/xylan/chitin deacetylase (PgdA/CDA1 family)